MAKWITIRANGDYAGTTDQPRLKAVPAGEKGLRNLDYRTHGAAFLAVRQALIVAEEARLQRDGGEFRIRPVKYNATLGVFQ